MRMKDKFQNEIKLFSFFPSGEMCLIAFNVNDSKNVTEQIEMLCLLKLNSFKCIDIKKKRQVVASKFLLCTGAALSFGFTSMYS